uniref:Uncharacterized protein n=1 Tax=Oryza glumipatula TaxID=40148 RepID=A0A0E0A534_9ORYZ
MVEVTITDCTEVGEEATTEAPTYIDAYNGEILIGLLMEASHSKNTPLLAKRDYFELVEPYLEAHVIVSETIVIVSRRLPLPGHGLGAD